MSAGALRASIEVFVKWRTDEDVETAQQHPGQILCRPAGVLWRIRKDFIGMSDGRLERMSGMGAYYTERQPSPGSEKG